MPTKAMTIAFNLPFLSLGGTWEPDQAERDAAWELLVELSTRTSMVELADKEGSTREALSSLYKLFDTTRGILRAKGPTVARNHGDGNLSFAVIAVRVLNDVLRPVLSEWHPRLDQYEQLRPPTIGASDWEHAWEFDDDLRRLLAGIRPAVRQYVMVLAEAAQVPELANAVLVPNGGASQASAGPGMSFGNRHARSVLGFRPQRQMVRWFGPGMACVIAWRMLRIRLGKLDARRDLSLPAGPTLQHTLPPGDATPSTEYWFDYVADTGDAFEPTMTVAWWAGRNRIEKGNFAAGADLDQVPPSGLPRGKLLVLGGDEVYPYGTDRRYRNQIAGPYGLALPDGESSDLLVLPGNHDWYDNLEAFRKTFCRGATIGRISPRSARDETGATDQAGWKTHQTASWFAAQLPGGWWLWGIDTALFGDINDSQHAYFLTIGAQLAPDDRIILCTPIPLWSLREKMTHRGEETELRAIEDFVAAVVPSHASVPVYLAGDSHFYAHYVQERGGSGPSTDDEPVHHITSGGGGAFMHPTHNLAPKVPQSHNEPGGFQLTNSWPPRTVSRHELASTSRGIVVDRQSVALGGAFGLLHLAGLVALGWRYPSLARNHRSASGNVRESAAALGESARHIARHVVTSPWTIGLAVFVLALFTFVLPKPNVADPNVRRAARRTGFLHAILQLGLLLLVEGGIGLLFAHFDGRHQWGSWPAAFAVALSVSIGGLVATLLFGKYVTFVNQRYRVFDNIAFSGRHIRGYKQFLRFRMNVATGDLTIFVVGIDTIERGWASALATGGRPPAGRLTLVDVIEVPGSRRAAPVAVTPPTQVTVPQPTLVTAPEPTLVTAPEPTLVTAPAPILAEPVPVAMSQPTPVALPEGRGPNLGRFARSFEAVVIGTGFGGAVVACRLSQKWPGKVLVLERGKRYPAGSFARTPKEMANNFWNADGERKGPLRYRHHEQRGLFDIRSFKKMDAVMAAGYGGGSLIYANVILEPPDTVFNDERWPDTCAKEALRPYYDTVREVLHARPIPPPTTPDRRIPRTEIFEQAATKMGRRSRRLDLAVHFGNDDASPLPRGRSEANRYGADQTSCTYCGECDIGCNAHAKNSLDLNYLYVAEHCHHAVVETDSLVELIVPLDANGSDDAGGDGTHGYRVQYRDLNASYSTSVRTNRVIVSAGSLGSTELLLRCRDVHRTLPNLSLLLGRGFSGNGDFLSFITGSALDTEPIYGPVITQGIDFNLFEGYDPERAFIMEDAGYPNQMAWLVEGSKPRVFKIQAIGRTLKHTAQRWVTGRAKGRVGYRLHDLLRGDISGGSAVVLCMGIDTSTGTMRLGRNGWLNIDWPLQHNLALYNAIRKASKDFKKAIYANVVTTAPNWWLPFRRNVTVHALGGCNLGPTLNDGVVSSDPVDFGQVFGYRGLYVADGAIVPTAVGANPSLTIAALAEMVAHGITGQLPSADLGTGRARPSSTATP